MAVFLAVVDVVDVLVVVFFFAAAPVAEELGDDFESVIFLALLLAFGLGVALL